MSITFSGTKYGYTDNGNMYKKSKIGKRIGTIAGLAVLYPSLNLGFKLSNKYIDQAGVPKIKSVPDFLKKISKFVKKGPELGNSLMATVFCGDKMGKVMKFLSKSKIGRAGVAGLVLGLPVAVYALSGRLLGHFVDKIIDHKSKKRADA